MIYSYKIHQNIYQDAWNWWDACNSTSHGVDWKKKINPKIVKNIHGKRKKEAYVFLIPFLRTKYKKEKDRFKESKESISNQFKEKFEIGCKKIVKMMRKPLYRRDFRFYLTTFKRAPYNIEKGLIWLPIDYLDPISVFLHELCHFQFFHYWRKNPKSPVSQLSDEQFEFLKESLTIILDKDFLSIIRKPDQGYKLHQDFRKELSKFWKKEKDFNKLVEFGTKKVAQIHLT